MKAGDVLYRIESKEQHALGNGNHAVIPIKVERDGIVLDVRSRREVMSPRALCFAPLPKPEALYSKLMSLTNSNGMRTAEAKCMLELPEGTRLTATVHAPLVTMNMVSQSERDNCTGKSAFLAGRHECQGCIYRKRFLF